MFSFYILGTYFESKASHLKHQAAIISMKEALEGEDYQKVITLANSHEPHDNQEINGLKTKAKTLLRRAAEVARIKSISKLESEIESADGELKAQKLEELLILDPETEKFSDELAAIRERAAKEAEEAEQAIEAERQAAIARREKAQEEQNKRALESKLAQYKWKYRVTKDQLTDKDVFLATATSLNQVEFDFPYKGAQNAVLMLRTHPQHGKDLILKVSRGQMLVRSYEDSKVKVVFDSGAPISYNVVGPSDRGTTSLFFRGYHEFVTKMLKSKRVKVSVPFYKEGNVVFEFDVSDFDTQKYLGKK